MPQNNLSDTISAMGANTIMGSLAQYADTTQESVKELKENQENLAETAIDKLAAKAMTDAYIRRHPIVKDNNVRRNDPCPCGSGKKYKNCCLNSGRYETYTRI